MRRAVILPAVLVILAVGALIGTSALYFADAGRRAASAGLDQGQVRALAWSGLQAAMSELAAQREALIAGEAPELTAEWVAFETAGGRQGLFRLLPIGPAGERAVSEAGKLNLNVAPAEAIAKLPGLDEQIAAAIVAARPLASLDDLLAIEAVSWEMVYGSAGDDAAAGQETSADQGVAGTFAGGGARALADTATVYSFDPNIQCGLDDEQWRGDRRLNLNVDYNERLGRALDDRFGPGTGDGVRQIMEAAGAFERDADFVAVLRLLEVDPGEWGPILDALTTSDDEYLSGRVDVNLAPVEVLAALPGLDAEIARGIVDRRESMSPRQRRSAAWPVAEDLLTPEQFEGVVDLVATRSMQWRVRVEAGLTAPGATGFGAGADELSFDEFGVLDSGESERLERRVVLEAVIDVASQRPRVAFLREVTHEGLSRRLAAGRGETEVAARDERPRPPREAPVDDDPRARHLVDLDLSPPAPEAPAAPGPADSGGAGEGGRDQAAPDEARADSAGAGGDEPVFVDRRRGRWTAGGAR